MPTLCPTTGSAGFSALAENPPLDPMVGDWKIDLNGKTQKLKVWVGPSGTLQAHLDGEKVGITPFSDGIYCIHGFTDKPPACWMDIHLDSDHSGSVSSQHGIPGTITKV